MIVGTHHHYFPTPTKEQSGKQDTMSFSYLDAAWGGTVPVAPTPYTMLPVPAVPSAASAPTPAGYAHGAGSRKLRLPFVRMMELARDTGIPAWGLVFLATITFLLVHIVYKLGQVHTLLCGLTERT